MYDYPDLYREAANVLRGQNYFHEALRYYEPLQQVSEYGDAHYYQELGACYRAVGLRAEAEDCFNTILKIDSRNTAARTQLAQMRREAGVLQRDLQVGEALSVRQHKTRRPAGNKGAKKSTREKASTIWSIPPMLAPRPVPQSAKKSALEKGKARDEDIQALFLRREELTEEVETGNESSKAQWMTATKALIEEFSGNKVFYPIDKHHRFYGYTKEARNLAARPKYEIDAQMEPGRSSPSSTITNGILTNESRDTRWPIDSSSGRILRHCLRCLARHFPRVWHGGCKGGRHQIYLRNYSDGFPRQRLLPFTGVTISHPRVLVW